MIDNPLIACCGVDCKACPDYREKKCPSCRATVWATGDECMPVACCREKQIDCCAGCASFPCADMAAFYEESDGHCAAYARMCALREASGAKA